MNKQQLVDKLNKMGVEPDWINAGVVDLWIGEDLMNEDEIQELNIEGLGKDRLGFWAQTSEATGGIVVYYKNGEWV